MSVKGKEEEKWVGGRTEGHLGEEMVRDVIMRDIMQEIPACPAQEGPVDRARRTAQERPCALPEVRQCRLLDTRARGMHGSYIAVSVGKKILPVALHRRATARCRIICG